MSARCDEMNSQSELPYLHHLFGGKRTMDGEIVHHLICGVGTLEAGVLDVAIGVGAVRVFRSGINLVFS